VGSESAGVQTIEVSHEALIREWQRLADWVRDGRDDIRLQHQIGENAQDWLRDGRPVDRLYRGAVLAAAQAWRERGAPNTDEVAFIQASVAKDQQERELEIERIKRELALRKRAGDRARLSVLALLLLILASVFGVVQVRNANSLEAANAKLKASLPVTVTNSLDDGSKGSLRTAIDTAPEGATITFQEGLSDITLKQGELLIMRNIVITGPAIDTLKISGADSTRVFKTGENVAVTISNLTITNGHVQSPDCQTDKGFTDGSGGGLLVGSLSTVTLVNVGITDSSASCAGGGIVNLNGVLNIVHSALSGNSAPAGGGILNGGRLFLNASTMSGNTAADGGDILSRSGLVDIISSTVSDATCVDVQGASAPCPTS
jgi:hypothetical protein